MRFLHPTHRTPGARRLILISLVCVIGLGSLVFSSISAQPTPPVQPTFPTLPTQPSIPTQPPPPTQFPPTAAPTEQPTKAPTAAPTTPPTEPSTVVPTEQPTEVPTGAPTVAPATAPPPPPTTAPTSPPRPGPTQPAQQLQPATPQTAGAAAAIECEAFTGASGATPADVGWTLYACEVELDFGPLASLALRAETDTPGWRVILVDEDAPDTPGLLDASNNRLELDGLDGDRAATFILGVQASCTAFRAATVDIEVTGARPGAEGATIGATGSVALTLPSESPPDVSLDSLDLTGDRAALDIRYVDAPAECGWQLLVTLGTDDAIAIAIDDISGPDGVTGTAADGLVSILVPAAGDDPTTGTIGVTLQLTEDAAVQTVLIEAITFP